jgi:hypothetical protein
VNVAHERWITDERWLAEAMRESWIRGDTVHRLAPAYASAGASRISDGYTTKPVCEVTHIRLSPDVQIAMQRYFAAKSGMLEVAWFKRSV